MQAPPPRNESQRLQKLQCYNVLDTKPEAAYDDLTQLASLICQTPIALISLIDKERQWFKSVAGLHTRETHRDLAFCAHAILSSATLIVSDALQDPRFADNDLVTGEPHIRFYAGAPLVTPDGFVLGTLCVIDSQPRTLSQQQVIALESLARQVVSQLELRLNLKRLADEIDERNGIEAKLLETQHELSEAQAIAQLGNWANVPDSNLISMSEEAARIFGFASATELSFHDFIAPIHPDDRDALCQAFERASSGADCYLLEIRLLSDEGVTRHVACRGKPVVNDHGEVTQIVGTVQDITSYKIIELALQQAKAKAETASQTKTEFLANVSHELRTPLNAILGFAQLIDREPDFPNSCREYLSTILSSGNHLLSLINSVLDLSKIEACRMKVSHSTVDLLELLESVDAMLKQQAIAKGLRLETNIDSSLPRYVHTDAQKLRQILLNLLNNSIKFTQQGCVRLVAEWIPQSDRQSTPMLQIRVQDTGPGIEREDHQRIFEAFEQTESSKHTANSTGLGLTLSAHFINLMDGTICLESQVDEGTTFVVTLPMKEVSRRKELFHYIPEMPVLHREQPLTRPRILLVDDQSDNRKLVMKLLGRANIDIQEAKNGAIAVETWKNWKPDLILMDMRMPVMDGYEATQKIRYLEAQAAQMTEASENDPANSTKTKIIAVTASAFADDRLRIIEAGCDDVVYKPYRVNTLYEAIATHLNLDVEDLRQSVSNSNSKSFDFAKKTTAKPKSTPPPSKRQGEDFSPVLSGVELDVMPQSWQDALYDAAYCLNEQTCRQLIALIPASSSRLAQFLIAMVDDFRFELICNLLQESKKSASVSVKN